MVKSSDTFGFNNIPLFQKVRESLPDEKTHNILESKDDLLFVWDSRECCLLTLNWRAAKAKGYDKVQYQTLLLSAPQMFQVDKVLCSHEGTLIALAGARGLSILELPRRWGPNGLFLEGKEKIICKSKNLDERFFVNNSQLELLQIRWHPASQTDSHILALLSDNSIRVYDESTLKHVWRVGPIPNAPQPSNGSNLPFLNSLGETAVDFDIAPPRVVSQGRDDIKDSRINNSTYISETNFNIGTEHQPSITQQTSSIAATAKKVEWPIVILRGNGNVYVLCASIDTKKPRLQGPLTIEPSVEDNYGVDSCAILVIPSIPYTVVIAENTGKLYHAILLETENLEKSFNETDSSLIIDAPEWVLYVLETVEIELGITESKKTKSHNCPIHLKRDHINDLRYFAYHNTGLHAVTVNFVKQLQYFIESEKNSSAPSLTTPSQAEYIVCTKAYDRGKINAVLGFVLLQLPSAIVLILSSGQIISLNLVTDINLLSDWIIDSDKNKGSSKLIVESPLQTIMQESFVTHIRDILKGGVSQPILSLDKTCEPTTRKAYELLMQTLRVLREQYFKKHENARNEIIKRVNILKLLKAQQEQELDQLEMEKEHMRANAERLAEKYEEIYDKQQELNKKVTDLVRQSNVYLPNKCLSDEQFPGEVQKIDEATKKIKRSLEQVRKSLSTQQMHISGYKKDAQNKITELSQRQETTIKEVISGMNNEIDCQIKAIKKIHEIVNIK